MAKSNTEGKGKKLSRLRAASAAGILAGILGILGSLHWGFLADYWGMAGTHGVANGQMLVERRGTNRKIAGNAIAANAKLKMP